jgi:hypothetical protein
MDRRKPEDDESFVEAVEIFMNRDLVGCGRDFCEDKDIIRTMAYVISRRC